ncbi:MAG: hypothetical protein LUO89_08260 [Methanothrix sp.]|nr:hypothetical protein [Methanothrix sp.]
MFIKAFIGAFYWLYEKYIEVAQWTIEGEWYEVLGKVTFWLGLLFSVRTICFAIRETYPFDWRWDPYHKNQTISIVSDIILILFTGAFVVLLIIILWLVFGGESQISQ